MTAEETTLPPSSRALYEQKRRVELLRQQVFAQVEPAQAGRLAGELLAEETRLAEMQQANTAQAGAGEVPLYPSPRERAAPVQEKMGRDTTGVETSIYLRLSHVPTGIVHLFDPEEEPLVSVKISNPGRQVARLRITVWVEDYSAAAVNTLELHTGEEKEVKQLPVFFSERLRSVCEITRASLRVHVQHLSGVTEMERSFPIWLLARTTAYLELRDPKSGRMIDLTPFLAAWVTPNAPEVMELLGRAVSLHPQRHLSGYQADETGVEEQVRAIYNAVKAEQVQYVNSVFCFGRSGGEYMQRLRLPRETLKTRSANCLDATVLVASLLEAASLNPAIVLVPGHAFVAWETQPDSGCWDYLEATLIGSQEFQDARQVGRALANRYEGRSQQQMGGRLFRRLPVPELRVDDRILPME